MPIGGIFLGFDAAYRHTREESSPAREIKHQRARGVGALGALGGPGAGSREARMSGDLAARGPEGQRARGEALWEQIVLAGDDDFADRGFATGEVGAAHQGHRPAGGLAEGEFGG